MIVPPGSTPLPRIQSEQLTQILANSSASYKSGGNADQNDIDWDNALNQAAGLLSEDQLRAFKALAGYQKVSIQAKRFSSQGQANGP
jgi:hypothetical protein